MKNGIIYYTWQVINNMFSIKYKWLPCNRYFIFRLNKNLSNIECKKNQIYKLGIRITYVFHYMIVGKKKCWLQN